MRRTPLLYVGVLLLALSQPSSASPAPTKQTEASRSLERDLADGVGRARRGDTVGSDPVLRRVAARSSGATRATALRYLAFNAARRGDRRLAVVEGQRALDEPGQSLAGNDLDQFRQDVEAWRAFADAPTLRVIRSGAGNVRTLANQRGRPEVAIDAGGRSWHALLDTGAERSVVSAAMASALGVRPLPVLLHDTGSTGAQQAVKLGLLPSIAIGPAVIANVPVEILDDDAMRLGKDPIDLIVGYETLRLLDTLTLHRDGGISIGDTNAGGAVSATLLEDGLVPVLYATVDGRPGDLLLDTGANSTILTRAFYLRNLTRLADADEQTMSFSGIGGEAKRRKLTLPRVTFTFARGTVALVDVALFPEASQLDVAGLVGNAGRDLWRGRYTATIDFRRHELRLR